MNAENKPIYMSFNAAGAAFSYIMLADSIYDAPVDFSTKCYWAMGIGLLTLALLNVVKYRLKDRASSARITTLEAAKADKILEEYEAKKDEQP